MSADAKALLSTLLNFRYDQSAGFAPLLKAVDGVDVEHAAWKPDESAHSIWELVNHIAFWDEYVLAHLKGLNSDDSSIDNELTFTQPVASEDEAAWYQAVNRVRSVFGEMREAVFSMTDSDLDKPFDESPTTVKTMLGDIAMHDAYHIGQIMYVRRLQGI